MKAIIITSFFFFLAANISYCQVGIGTQSPNASSQLDIVANDKGVLVTRVALTSSTDITTISNGNVESLLVYNTATVADVVPGFYYWDGTQWTRLSSSNFNETLTAAAFDATTGILTYTDELSIANTLNLASMIPNFETLTNISQDNTAGTITYIDEDGASTVLNISTLISANETLTIAVFDSTTGILTYTDEAGTANTLNLSTMIPNFETLTSVSQDNAAGTITYIDEDGTSTVLNITALITAHETLTTTTFDAVTGILTYTDEAGTANALNLSTMIPNFETLTSVSQDNTAGTVTYVDEDGASTVLNIAALIAVNEPWLDVATGTGATQTTSNLYLGPGKTISVGTQTPSLGKVATFAGDVDVEGVLDPTKLIFSNAAGTNSSYIPSANGEFQLEFQEGLDLNFLSNTTDDIFHLKNSGNIGIGTANPLTKLHINNSTKTELTIEANNLAGVSETTSLLHLRASANDVFLTVDRKFPNNTSKLSLVSTDNIGGFLFDAKTQPDINNIVGNQLWLQSSGEHIGMGTTSPNSDALLDMTSTNKGLLLPRLALDSTDSFSPLSAHVEGMVVYNTATNGDVTPGYYFNNGTVWIRFLQEDLVDLKLIGNNNHITRDAGIGGNGNQIGGAENVGIGTRALFSNQSGSRNVAIGQDALGSNIGGSNNQAIGRNALDQSVTADRNSAFGNNAFQQYNGTGSYNIALGYSAGQTQLDGSNNIFLGYNTQPNISATASNQLNIGNWIYGNNGFIGINEPKPVSKLQIGGAQLATNETVDQMDEYRMVLYSGSTANTFQPNRVVGFSSRNSGTGQGTNGSNMGLHSPYLFEFFNSGVGTAVMSLNAENGNLGLGTTSTSNARFEVASGTSGESGIRTTNMTASSNEVTTGTSAIGVDADGDVVPVMRNETVFVGKVSVGSVIPTGYQNLPLDVVYDPLNLWNSTTHTWVVPNDDYIYEYHVSLNRYSDLMGGFTFYRPNSATLIPINTTTGQQFAFSYIGITSGNPNASGLRNQYSGIPIKLNNASGAPITLTGIEFDRGYWTLTIKRLAKY